MIRASSLALPETAKTELIGQRFGWLVVTGRNSSIGGVSGGWVVRCDCGQERVYTASALRRGNNKSCGCQRRRLIANANLRHGHAGRDSTSRTFKAWGNMKARCTNPRHSAYRNYGARGISFAPAWAVFDNFLADMGETPPGMQLDRIDNNGPYSKENCRWATVVQQNNNKRTNRYLEYKGVIYTLAEIARMCKINYQTLQNRLERGDNLEQAMRPVRKAQEE